MSCYHTRWVRPAEPAEDPERIAIQEALACGRHAHRAGAYRRRTRGEGRGDRGRGGMHGRRRYRAHLALLRWLAAVLDADVHLTGGHGLGSVRFEPRAAH
jgi:hypothetical protein